MHLLYTILIGFVVGLLARALKPGDDRMGVLMTTLLGVGGALLAKFVGERLHWYSEGQPAGFVAAIVGAMVLLLLYGLIRKRTP
jgi:uncharacterized membrane protein YeaQ/YmgE (transglycosylase-associated protein family)